eukprot:1161423-Pelagomonas_calceolata.AAC.8
MRLHALLSCPPASTAYGRPLKGADPPLTPIQQDSCHTMSTSHTHHRPGSTYPLPPPSPSHCLSLSFPSPPGPAAPKRGFAPVHVQATAAGQRAHARVAAGAWGGLGQHSRSAARAGAAAVARLVLGHHAHIVNAAGARRAPGDGEVM